MGAERISPNCEAIARRGGYAGWDWRRSLTSTNSQTALTGLCRRQSRGSSPPLPPPVYRPSCCRTLTVPIPRLTPSPLRSPVLGRAHPVRPCALVLTVPLPRGAAHQVSFSVFCSAKGSKAAAVQQRLRRLVRTRNEELGIGAPAVAAGIADHRPAGRLANVLDRRRREVEVRRKISPRATCGQRRARNQTALHSVFHLSPFFLFLRIVSQVAF